MSAADIHLERTAKPPHYPKAKAEEANPLTLVRQVPVRPGRFPVGLDRPDRSLTPPSDKIRGTAIAAAAYLGRVDEVAKSGEITVTLWERPNGREGLTALDAKKHLEGKRPEVGDLLWIWTWTDVAGTGRRKDRIHVEIETRTLGDAERAQLRDLLRAIEESQSR